MQTYGVDLFDVGTARLSWRRLWSLLAHLPRESRFAQATAGASVSWGYTEHLLATLVDVAQIGNWMFASAHSKLKVDKPHPLPRPGADVERGSIGRPRYTFEQMRRKLDHWGEGMVAVGTREVR